MCANLKRELNKRTMIRGKNRRELNKSTEKSMFVHVNVGVQFFLLHLIPDKNQCIHIFSVITKLKEKVTSSKEEQRYSADWNFKPER